MLHKYKNEFIKKCHFFYIVAKKVYLHQFLSKTGQFQSKREISDAIYRGDIKINNEIIRHPFYQFRPNLHSVSYQGKQLTFQSKNIYLILNKPKGYLSGKLSQDDQERSKRSVFDLLGPEISAETKNTIFCIGRLDEDTSGLLLLTTDGDFSFAITNPKSNVPKTYAVFLERPLSKEDKEQIEQGLTIKLEENGINKHHKTKPSKITLQSDVDITITITEGKKREVRRIFEAVGNRVRELKRLSIGKLTIDEFNLQPGQYVKVEKEFLIQKIGLP